MSGQRWRKALWHLRNGGVEGYKDFRRRSKSELDSPRRAGTASGQTAQSDGIALSVVIPAFNASDHIEACLRSVLSQKGVSLEIIVVDDGSTDDTVEKVNRCVDGDDRVTLLTGDNEGPAIARNRGVGTARGTYIAFVDADDEVLTGAYSSMIDSLERTGSDIATGSYIRIGKFGRSRPKLTARVHARQRLAVRLDDMPELLEEPVLWNKIYRLDFWNRHVGEMWGFPNYEDQEPVYRALVGAAAIDVLTEDVYGWRLADGRDTRSQHKAKLTDLHAKLEVIEALRTTLEYAPENVLERAYSIWMGTDLAMHAEYLDTASKRFHKTLCSATNDLKKAMPRSAWKLIPAQERLFMWVVATGRLDDIEEILGTRLEETTAVPLEYADGRWNVAPTYVNRLETSLPSRLLKARPVDFKPVVLVRNARWLSDGILELQGCAYIPGIAPDEAAVRIQGVMDGATIFDLPVDSRDDNWIDLEAGDPWRSYAAGGFRVHIDIREIQDISPRGIDLFGSFDAQSARFNTPATASTVVDMIAPSPLVAEKRVTVIADEQDRLSIRPVTIPAAPVVAKNVSFHGETVTVTLSPDADVRAVEMVYGREAHPLAVQDGSIFTGRLPALPEKYNAGGERVWSLRARSTEGRTEDIYYDSVDYLLPHTGRARPEPDIDGKVKISHRAIRVSITGASSDRDRLMLTGRIDPPQRLSVVLRSSGQTIAPTDSTVHADGGFTTVYDLTTTGPEGGTVAALAGGYHVCYGATPETHNSWARVAGRLAIRPVDVFTKWNTLRLEGRSSGAVAVTASPPWSSNERTRYGRFILRKTDWGPISGGILFESFNGKSCNDNPRALFEGFLERGFEPPLYWSVRDRTVEVPPGGIPVVEGSADWHKALATTRMWVNNNNFPYYVVKRTGQYYLQTWHGTPIKKLAADIPRRNVSLTYRRIMRRETSQWDLLLAQSTHAAALLRSGLAYNGAVKIMESPRNRRLGWALNRTDTIRKKFGLDSSERAVLYVPTWRDAETRSALPSWKALIDPDKFARETKSTVLLRAHHMVQVEKMETENVIDVSKYPHVEDLLAIADILITDYSSVAYDYVITGRTPILYVPDLCEYERLRGIYQPLEQLPFAVTSKYARLVKLTTGELPLPAPKLTPNESKLFDTLIDNLMAVSVDGELSPSHQPGPTERNLGDTT